MNAGTRSGSVALWMAPPSRTFDVMSLQGGDPWAFGCDGPLRFCRTLNGKLLLQSCLCAPCWERGSRNVDSLVLLTLIVVFPGYNCFLVFV